MIVKAASIHDIPDGTMKTVAVSGRKLAIAQVDGEFFAIDDTCSHEECSLGSDGFLDGRTVICGCHGAQFDVMSGSVLSLPAVSGVRSYPVSRQGDDLLVDL